MSSIAVCERVLMRDRWKISARRVHEDDWNNKTRAHSERRVGPRGTLCIRESPPSALMVPSLARKVPPRPSACPAFTRAIPPENGWIPAGNFASEPCILAIARWKSRGEPDCFLSTGRQLRFRGVSRHESLQGTPHLLFAIEMLHSANARWNRADGLSVLARPRTHRPLLA